MSSEQRETLGTVDIEALRKTHVYGWGKVNSILIEISVLAAVLDELEILRALEPVREEMP